MCRYSCFEDTFCININVIKYVFNNKYKEVSANYSNINRETVLHSNFCTNYKFEERLEYLPMLKLLISLNYFHQIDRIISTNNSSKHYNATSLRTRLQTRIVTTQPPRSYMYTA